MPSICPSLTLYRGGQFRVHSSDSSLHYRYTSRSAGGQRLEEDYINNHTSESTDLTDITGAWRHVRKTHVSLYKTLGRTRRTADNQEQFLLPQVTRQIRVMDRLADKARYLAFFSLMESSAQYSAVDRLSKRAWRLAVSVL